MPHRKAHAHRHAHAARPRPPPAPSAEPDIAAQAVEPGVRPDGALRQHMIAEAAYYRALNRGFNGGDPDEDWFVAEREIAERFGIEH